eukprot:PhM_4_TR13102/c0_g1_i1/m.65095
MASSGAVYGLELQARNVAAVLGDQENHYFLVGTSAIRSSNQIILLQYVESTQSIDCIAVWQTKGELWSVAPSPLDKSHFLTIQSPAGTADRTLNFNTMDIDSLDHKVTSTSNVDATTHSVHWDMQGLSETVVSTNGSSVQQWKVEASGIREVATTAIQGKDGAEPSCASAWDPHHSEIVMCGSGSDLVRVDMRQKKSAVAMEDVHRGAIHDMEYNPNKIYQVATCGEDGTMSIWDVRKKDGLLKRIDAHDHWVNTVRYNPQHDQFIVTGASDNTAKLWLLPSIASSSVQFTPEEEGLVKVCRDFEDSIYSVAWSACSPWVFLGVSYNGKVIAHTIPKELKYRILLSDE